MTVRDLAGETANIFDVAESNVRYYCRHMPVVFAKAQNARVWDDDNREYIDLLSACGSLNYGHNHPAIKARVLEYLDRDGILNALDLHTEAKRDFLHAFRSIVLRPAGMDYKVQFTGPTGTNAVEAALKLSRKVTGRKLVVAFTNAFHGMTLGAISVSARESLRKSAGVSFGEDVARLPFDGYEGAGVADLNKFEKAVEEGAVKPPAAFLVETVQGEGGLNVASREWLQHLARIARRLGSLLIIDDVQAGCGRTGTFFSFEFAGIQPDLVCMAKSIGGIGLPMALLLVKAEHDLWAPGEHNGTFRGNNLAFVAAKAALELWQDPDFQAGLRDNIRCLRDWLVEMSRDLGPSIVSINGRGLMMGLAFADFTIADSVARGSFEKGVLIETSGASGEVLKLLPPLTIERDLLLTALGRVEKTVVEVLGDRIVAMRSAA